MIQEQIGRLSTLCELLSTPRRTEIAHILHLRAATPSELDTISLLSTRSNISQHLSILKKAGAVLEERNGASITYRMNPDFVHEIHELINMILPLPL